MELLNSLIGFIIAIGILVTFHEYGHFIVARFCNVKVLKFSVGFGKPIFSTVSKKSNTEYSLCMIPLGGYVQMLESKNAEGDLNNIEEEIGDLLITIVNLARFFDISADLALRKTIELLCTVFINYLPGS